MLCDCFVHRIRSTLKDPTHPQQKPAQRRDEQGRVWAEVVIKQEDRRAAPDQDAPGTEVSGHRGLLVEALVQRDLNRLDGSININHLYDFKYNTQSNQFRLFQISNPHQDLSQLKTKYSMFDTFLPETFLWTVFVSLLEGVLLMESDPTGKTMQEAIPDGSTKKDRPFLLHLDWKLNNIFLDYSKSNEDYKYIWDDYPIIRIADFGLARYTHLKDDGNPLPDLHWRMTQYWKPPEMIAWKQVNKYIVGDETSHHWNKNKQWVHPDSDDEDDDGVSIDLAYEYSPNPTDQPYDKSLNLWCVGKIMFDLCTMFPDDSCQRLMDGTDEYRYEDMGTISWTRKTVSTMP